MTKLTKEQIRLLEKELEELEEASKRRNLWIIIGIALIIIGLTWGFVGNGFVFISFELIVGILLLVFGIKDNPGQKAKEIRIKLAGDKEWLKKHPKEKTELEKWGEKIKY